MLSEGWAHPLTGFMREKEYLQTLHFNCILNEDSMTRNNHSVPIVLSLSETDKKRLEDVSAMTLVYDNNPVAILRKPEFYFQRKEERCSRQFGTTNVDHPYIKVHFIIFLHIFILNFHDFITLFLVNSRFRSLFGGW